MSLEILNCRETLLSTANKKLDCFKIKGNQLNCKKKKKKLTKNKAQEYYQIKKQ